MAADEAEPRGTEEKVRRGVVRSIGNTIVLLASLAVIGAWLWSGQYEIGIGEQAVILRWGQHDRTVGREGLNWHWPVPIERDVLVNTSGVRTLDFGMRSGTPLAASDDGPLGAGASSFESFIRTSDSNIVSVSFDLQYTVDDAFAYEYGMHDAEAVLYEATQAAVREVIGSKTVDEVLYSQKESIETEAQEILDITVREYFAGSGMESAFTFDKVNLQTVTPPAEVREAFDDVVSAKQDEDRSTSLASGDAREIAEKAQAEASEIRERSVAYKEAKLLESRGEAVRFEALLAEYALAPEVTRRRLYLETMEAVMPQVEKMVIEPDAVSLMPFVPFQAQAPRQAPASAGSGGDASSASGEEAGR